jgi:hypothetical protein
MWWHKVSHLYTILDIDLRNSRVYGVYVAVVVHVFSFSS